MIFGQFVINKLQKVLLQLKKHLKTLFSLLSTMVYKPIQIVKNYHSPFVYGLPYVIPHGFHMKHD